MRIQPIHRGADGAPLSWFQERLWILNQKNPGDTSYNLPVAFLIEGPLDTSALARSLTAVVNRHENLRARFVSEPGKPPVQQLSAPKEVKLPVLAVTPNEVAQHVAANAQHHFDLALGPVIISRLLRLEPNQHVLLLNVHHIVSDGWSIEGILFSELQNFYRAFCENTQPDLPPLPIQYVDYAAWQRKQDVSSHIEYWRGSLQDYDERLELPTDFLRRPTSGARSASFSYKYSKEFSAELDRFSHRHNATLFMSLLAGLTLVASRYTGSQDLCIGTTASGRPLPELERLIGFFVNILPLRIRVDKSWSVREYLAEVRKISVMGFEHQAVPFEHILQSLGMSQGEKGAALVPLIMRHQNFPQTRMNQAMPGGVRFSDYSQRAASEDLVVSEHASARCEVELSYTGNRDQLEVKAVYAADLYTKETIDRLLRHHEQLLIAMFEDDRRPVGDLEMLSRAEIHRLSVEHNRAGLESSRVSSFVERFDEQVQRSPKRIACRDRSGSLTYGALAKRANRLAHALSAKGIGPGDLVGVCLERGAPVLISYLAIWRVGAAYVPLDPSYGATYLGQINANAAPKLVIGTPTSLEGLELEAAQCFDLVAESTAIEAFSAQPPATPEGFSPLAYVMYTSGSTGVPKGIRVPHQQLVNWLGGIEANWPFEIDDVVGQKTTIAFAPSGKELFAGLLNGIPQVFLDDSTVRDPHAFVSALTLHKVTRLNMVPSHLAVILKLLEESKTTLPSLRMCITAGEPLTAELVATFRTLLPHARLINNYGCTELNDITYYDTAEFDGGEGFVPVGRPIQHTHVYLLDPDKRLVPEGVTGELHVSTVGIPEGYHKLPELDATQFGPNPFTDAPDEQLFNTGDLAKHLPDGNIEFVGRRDFQVKIRGQRVDVRHVEKVLSDFPGTGLWAVVGADNQLTAYYAGNDRQPVDGSKLRQFLRARLPTFMVPAAVVSLDTLPRLANGKLDRRALRPELGELRQGKPYAAPSSDIERSIATIWSEVLGISNEEIGRDSDFFEIGGDSLATARVSAYVKDRLGVEIGMSELFESPRLVDLAQCLARVGQGGPSIERLDALLPLSDGALVKGKVVLVSGASRGIGSSAARLLASHGAKVALNYLSSDARAQRVKELIQSDGGVAELFQADVTDQKQVASMVDAVRETFGEIDVLVANAAIGFRMRSFHEYEWADFTRKLDDEVKSIFHLCKAVAPHMAKQGNGSIIAISSTMSRSWNEGFIAHSTAKSAVDAFVRSLASELGPEGVRVNTVAPGLILTDATANLSPHTKAAASARSPLRRNGSPRDVAGAVLFLASDLSEFITGSYLPVDGGLTML